jgi:hypothetical protein
MIDLLENAAANFDSIWLVARTPDDWPNRQIGPDWLARNMQEVRRTQIGQPPNDLPVQQFKRWEVHPSEIDDTPLVEFADVAELVGVQVMDLPEPTGELVVWIYWRPVGTTEKPFKAFLHLVGTVNPVTGTPLWSQDDHFPQNMHISTDSWPIGKIYRDVFKLPVAEVPPGHYTLNIGLYDPDTGQRILTDTGDSYEIAAVALP